MDNGVNPMFETNYWMEVVLTYDTMCVCVYWIDYRYNMYGLVDSFHHASVAHTSMSLLFSTHESAIIWEYMEPLIHAMPVYATAFFVFFFLLTKVPFCFTIISDRELMSLNQLLMPNFCIEKS